MTNLLLFLGFLLYCVQAAAVYLPAIKDSNYYIPIGLITSNLACIMWLYIAKLLKSKQDVLFYGAVWDALIMAAYCIVPLIFFSVPITRLGVLGIAMVVAGICVLKVSQL